MKRVLILLSLTVALVAGLAACGVKGDPVPPGTPPAIGRGRPKFEEISNPANRKAPLALPKNNKEEDDDSND